MHRKGDIDLSFISFSKICRLNEQELRIPSYMKDVVLHERNPTKFILYFSELYFLGYEFSKLDDGEVQNLKNSFFWTPCMCWTSRGEAVRAGAR
jgi:hypothetical protein